MQTGILTTNGGPHPADKWAAVSAAHIVSMIKIDQNSTSPAATAARRALPRFELELADALEPHHQMFQDTERKALSASNEHLGTPWVQHSEIDEQCAAVAKLASKTPFAAHFATPEVQAVVRDILQNHIASVQHIERKWHCDRAMATNKIDDHVAAFLARHTPPVIEG